MVTSAGVGSATAGPSCTAAARSVRWGDRRRRGRHRHRRPPVLPAAGAAGGELRSPMRCAPRSLFWISDPTRSPRLSSARSIARRWANRARSTSPSISPGRPAPSRPSSRRWPRRTSAPPSTAGTCQPRGRTPPTCSRRRRSSPRTRCWWSTTSPRPARPPMCSGCTARPIACSVPPATASGRARMRADGGSRPTYYPRGLIISTGEDIPSGQSLRARLLVLELTPGEIPADALSAAQADAANGLFAAAMAGYLRWLAPRIDDLRQTLPERQRTLRDDARPEARSIERTPDVAASLIVGWETFLRLRRRRRSDQPRRCRAAAHAGARRPHRLGRGAARAPGERGACHALPGSARRGDQQRPCSCRRRRYRDAARGCRLLGLAAQRSSAPATSEREVWRPNGERLGWIRDDDLLLEPETAFAAAQKLARDQGTSIPVKQRTLWKRLAEQGLLASRDPARGRTRCAGRSRACGAMCFTFERARWPLETDQPGDETDQRDETDQEERPGKPRIPWPWSVWSVWAENENIGVRKNVICATRSAGRSRYDPPGARSCSAQQRARANCATRRGPMIPKLTKLPKLTSTLKTLRNSARCLGQKLTSRHPKLTSGTAQRSDSCCARRQQLRSVAAHAHPQLERQRHERCSPHRGGAARRRRDQRSRAIGFGCPLPSRCPRTSSRSSGPTRRR